MNCRILHLFSILDDPVYQAGISKITCRAISPYPIYVNDSIVNFPDCYIHTAHEVFDEETVKEMWEDYNATYKNKNTENEG